MEDPDDYTPHLRFDEATRKRLSDLFTAAYKGRDFFPDTIEFEVEVTLGLLERYAAVIPEFQKFQPEAQKRRRDRAESLAIHLEGVIEQLKQLDDAALGFLARRGFEEVSELSGQPVEFPDGIQACIEAFQWREDNIQALTAFAFGVRKALNDLPQHPLNTSGKDYPMYAVPKELFIAMSIEDLFWRQKLNFTTSDSGFAAECLRAVYQLGGLDIDRVDYWLKQARDHEDSAANFEKRRQKHYQE